MSIDDWKYQCLVAVGTKHLPVLPGDYVIFRISGHRLFVTTAMPCEPRDNDVRGQPTMGQEIVGLMSMSKNGSTLTQIWLDWSGFNDFWTIQKIML